MKTIGEHLRKKRLDLGLLQKEVAQRLGVDTDSVTNWEKGRSSPRLHLIPKVIEFLGYTPFSDGGTSLGERIVQLRRALGIRQDQLARELGVDPSTLARWEQVRSRPSAGLRRKLSKLLDTMKTSVKGLSCIDDPT